MEGMGVGGGGCNARVKVPQGGGDYFRIVLYDVATQTAAVALLLTRGVRTPTQAARAGSTLGRDRMKKLFFQFFRVNTVCKESSVSVCPPFIRTEGGKISLSSSHHLSLKRAEVVGAPKMTSQPVSSIFRCSPLPSGTRRTPGLSIL